MATPSVAPNPDRAVPPANTGSRFKDIVSGVLMRGIQMERRVDPWVRPAFDATLRDPVARLITALINARRVDEHLALTEEKALPGEDEFNRSVIDSFQRQMAGLWKPGRYERGGNSKTHGIVRGEFVIHENLPAHLAQGVFRVPRTFPALVRFSGPGPYITPDIDDVGFMSISVKLMDVPGPKLLDEERSTQDFLAVCTPTFVTDDIRSNAKLQLASLQNATIFHFLNFHEPHLLNLLMQGLWTKNAEQSAGGTLLQLRAIPAWRRPGDAVLLLAPCPSGGTPIPRLPRRPPDDYLRLALEDRLAQEAVELELRVQVQTDSFRMPLENAGVLWPEKLSPRVPVATLRLPQQTVDFSQVNQMARRLSFNPWHCIAEHRPLGNQSRARRLMYATLSELRHSMNAEPHWEPTPGDLP